ncbi:MAG: sigma-70 family RNA polymerase sigma factor [Phycisphaerales bacterium]|nr:sigma-70 family RNA polymerase sigma factor [Phycisphaerales bacterium]
MESAFSDNPHPGSHPTESAAPELSARKRSVGADLADTQLVSAVAEGDRDALGRLYDRHAPRILSLLHRMLRRRDDAEDTMQEAFVEVWRRARSFDPARASVFGWITLIARSRAIDRIRKRRREQQCGMDAAFDAQCLCGCTVESGDLAGAARNALSRLPVERRRAIELSFFEGMTHEEISRRENLPLGTVKTRIRLGMLQIRDDLRGIQASDVA